MGGTRRARDHDADGDGLVTTEELKALDIDGDGKLSKVRSLGLCLIDTVV